MSEMSLVLSEKFTAEDAASIRAELGRRLQVGKPVSLRQRSIDPPSVIQLLGEAAAWLPLVVAATAFAKSFFGTLGKKAADAAWESAAAWKENKDLEPLVDVVTALIAAAESRWWHGENRDRTQHSRRLRRNGDIDLFSRSHGGGPDPVSLRCARREDRCHGEG